MEEIEIVYRLAFRSGFQQFNITTIAYPKIQNVGIIIGVEDCCFYDGICPTMIDFFIKNYFTDDNASHTGFPLCKKEDVMYNLRKLLSV